MLLLAGLVAAFALLATAIHFHAEIPGFDPLVEVVTGTGIVGARKSDVQVLVDGKTYPVRAYRSRISGESHAVIFLAGVPYRDEDGGRDVCNLKVGRDYLALFNDGGEQWFYPTAIGMIAGESATVSYYLEDDMKGFDAEYRIANRGDTVEYEIEPAPYCSSRIVFSIPMTWFGQKGNFVFQPGTDRIVDGNTLTVLPRRKISR